MTFEDRSFLNDDDAPAELAEVAMQRAIDRLKIIAQQMPLKRPVAIVLCVMFDNGLADGAVAGNADDLKLMLASTIIQINDTEGRVLGADKL